MTISAPASSRRLSALLLSSGLLASLMLSACATLQPGAETGASANTATTAAARPARPAIAAWTLDGRILVRQGEQRHSTGISWQHAGAANSAQNDEILLTTPLGQGLAELRRDTDGAHLRLADRREFRAADWEGLAVEVFGFFLPLSALPRWLVGDAPEHAKDIEHDELGRLRHMRADGWYLTYLDYERATADALPTLIELRRADIEARLKIDAWQGVR